MTPPKEELPPRVWLYFDGKHPYDYRVRHDDIIIGSVPHVPEALLLAAQRERDEARGDLAKYIAVIQTILQNEEWAIRPGGSLSQSGMLAKYALLSRAQAPKDGGGT